MIPETALAELRKVAEDTIAMEEDLGGEGYWSQEALFSSTFGPPTVLSLFAELDAARARAEELERRSLESQMLAYKWMEAHDKLAAGQLYNFPAPADLPNCESRLAEAVKALEEISTLTELSRNPVDDFDRGARAARLDAADIANTALASLCLGDAAGKEG